MSANLFYVLVIPFLLLATGCRNGEESMTESKIKVIFDTDANNELDDQHALAYLLGNGDVFAVRGVTVNATRSGGPIEEHYAEAERIIRLCNLQGRIRLYKGANGAFSDIEPNVDSATFDGDDAVNFIVKEALGSASNPLVVIAVGKLTNVALALKKAPSILNRIRVVWLGSNYPEPGEYNQENDTSAMNYLLNANFPFEMVTVRYGRQSGTDAVRVTQEEIRQKMPGIGPKALTRVTGRHGSDFDCFGDYSVDLFEHIDYHGQPHSRALFDMAAVAVVKNPSWASRAEIPCPLLIDDQWKERPGNMRKITVWENFDKGAIIADFFKSMKNFVPVDSI